MSRITLKIISYVFLALPLLYSRVHASEPIPDDDYPKISYHNAPPLIRSFVSADYIGSENDTGAGMKLAIGPELGRIVHLGLGGDFGYFGDGVLFGVSAGARLYPRNMSVYPFLNVGLGYGWGDVGLANFEKGVYFSFGAGIGGKINGYSGSKLLAGVSYRLQQFDTDDISFLDFSLGFLF